MVNNVLAVLFLRVNHFVARSLTSFEVQHMKEVLSRKIFLAEYSLCYTVKMNGSFQPIKHLSDASLGTLLP